MVRRCVYFFFYSFESHLYRLAGYEYTDTVSLSSALTVTGQGIGVASRSSGFSGYDGILGIGPLDLTEDTVNGLSTVPTITHTLKSQGKITAFVIPCIRMRLRAYTSFPISEAIGIYFAPTTSSSSANGELTFGGPDTSKVTSTVGYVPLTLTYPASAYWGINQTVTYGSTTLLPNNAGIVDTGTTLILLATDALKLYVNATGATYDSNTGLYKLSTAQYAALQPLNFVIGSTTYSLTANAQIFPRSLNRDIGGTTNTIYLIVADVGSIFSLQFVHPLTTRFDDSAGTEQRIRSRLYQRLRFPRTILFGF